MIKYKEVKITVPDYSDTGAICKELDVYGADGWLLVSPLVRVDDGSLAGIAARDEDVAPLTTDEAAEIKRLAGANKRPRGRPPKEKEK